MFPAIDATFSTQWDQSNGYTNLGADALTYSSTIDLDGWTMNDFTFGTVQAQFQDPGVYSSTAVSARTEIMDIISDIPLDDAALTIIKNNMGTLTPGMIGSAQDFTTIIYGNYRLYVPNLALGAFPGYLQLISSGSFGSKEPTASSSLYCYRIVKCAGVLLESLATPACRIGLFGTFFEESELPRMMRLKRSYELQQLV
jgi:hypothetical protein